MNTNNLINERIGTNFNVQSYEIHDSRVPLQLRDYDLIRRKKKVLDGYFTYQPSLFPISGEHIVSSCVDLERKLWAATATELIRFHIYGTEGNQVQRFSGEPWFTGEVQALLADEEYIWVLTDVMVSRIQYLQQEEPQATKSIEQTPVTEEGRQYGVLKQVSYQPAKLRPALQKEMKYYSPEQFDSASNVTDKERQEIKTGFAASTQLPEGLPIIDLVMKEQLTSFAMDGDTLWLGTKHGLQRLNLQEEDSRDWAQYFAGPRYLYGGDDQVTGLHPDGEQGIWVQNSKGIVHIQFKLKTLKEKADIYEQLIKDVHDRNGMVTDHTRFEVVNGKYIGRPVTKDNDGLWTAEYGIGEVFRYAVAKREKDQEEMARAKVDALRAVKAVLLLAQIPGRADGYLARSYIAKGDYYPNALWFEKQEPQEDGKRYAVAVHTKNASIAKIKHFLITDADTVAEAKQAYAQATGRDYDEDWGDELGREGVYPVILDKHNPDQVIWRLRSEIKEEVDPVLAELYTSAGYKDSDLWYKADTSSDEVVGHLPLYYFAIRYLFDGTHPEDEHLKKLAIKFVDRTVHHIVTRGFRLEDAHGNYTTWAKWFASYFLTGNSGADDCSLNATELMSFLKIGIYVTSLDEQYRQNHELYKKIYDELWDTSFDGTEDGKGYIHLMHKYIERKTAKLRRTFGEFREEGGVLAKQEDWTLMVNYSDENLFAMSFLPLIELELDENPESERVAHLRGVWNQWWGNMKRENNPFYMFIHQYTFPQDDTVDLQTAAWMLYRMPQYRIEYPVNNLHRRDILLLDHINYRDKGIKTVNRPLPPDETYIYKFNNSPFLVYKHLEAETLNYPKVDYQSGSMSAATWFTLPYWMGRHLGMLQGE